jgi:hypothetical protein
MALLLVAHDQASEGAQALEDAVWQLAESHLALPGSLLIESPVSARYLADHLRSTLRRAGLEGALLVTALTQPIWSGLSPEAEEWITARLD